MFKLTTLLLIFVGAVQCQNVVNLGPLATAGFTACAQPYSNTTCSVNLPYIGQGYHQLQEELTGASCGNTPSFYSSALQYSIDNTVWHNLFYLTGVVEANIGNQTNRQLGTMRVGPGSYPFLRIALGIVPASCTASFYYTGSLFPLSPDPSYDGFVNGFVAVSTGTTAVKTPLTTSGGISLAGAFVPFPVGMKVKIYGVTLTNLSAGAETLTIAFPDTSGTGCTATANSWFTIPLAVGSTTPQTFTLPVAAVPYWSNPAPFSSGATYDPTICINAGANASTHNFFATVVFRVEP